MGKIEKPVLDLLFFGDIVGKPGRHAVASYLQTLRETGNFPQVVAANAENVTHGFGLMERHYHELLNTGIDVLTGGNHTWDRREILEYIESADHLLRPANLPATMPGTGCRVFEIRGVKIGIINLIGQVFMGNYNSPWERLDQMVADLKRETPIVFLDFHAEATAEKIAMAHYCARLGVSAMVGTHTHVQTSDEQILYGQMGYLTDAGFNGAYDSVIGMDVDCSVMRLRSTLPARMEVAVSTTLQVNAVRFRIEPESGRCVSVERIRELLTPATVSVPEA